MSKVMTIVSLCGWWTLSSSSFMNLMAYSSITLVLGGHPKSWTFCTTFRYVFLNLEDCLISPNGGRDDSSRLPFNFSSLWSRPRKFFNFPCLMRFFFLLLQIKTLICVMPMISVEAVILVPMALVGISFHFFRPLQGWIILDLHKHLFKQHVQGRILLTLCWRTCLLVVLIFLHSRLGLLWTRTLLRMAQEICFHLFGSLPLLCYNCVLCIHEVLGRMDEFSHGLRLLLINFMDE